MGCSDDHLIFGLEFPKVLDDKLLPSAPTFLEICGQNYDEERILLTFFALLQTGRVRLSGSGWCIQVVYMSDSSFVSYFVFSLLVLE
jgi:hypothetical protein